MTTCVNCWGDGSLLEERADYTMMVLECPECHGTGELDTNTD